MSFKYALSGNGLVHLLSAINPEFTLCGDAFNNYEEDGEGLNHTPIGHGPVTCPRCIEEIENARGVKTRKLIDGDINF